MRVALAYPYTKQTDYQCYQPLALLYLATPLAAAGAEVRVFDLDGFPGGRRELLDEVVRFQPDVFGAPVFSDVGLMRGLRELHRELRRRVPRAVILAGGAHATACPAETLESFPEVDYLLRGEAEATLAEFVRQLEGNAGRPQVPGLCHRGSDGPVCVPQAEPPQDLDSIPFPDRGLLWDNYRRRVYYRLGRRPPADMIMTSRGCPFRCRFCFNVGKGYRLRDPANVVRELVYLRSLGITTIDFMDELFTGHRSRCMEICRLIREAGLKLDLKIRSHVRTLDREMLQALKLAGVSVVLFGVESGSDAMLTAMHKNASVADNARAIRLVKQAGMRCYADILLGFPGETRETIAETDRFLRRVRPTAIQVGTLLPFPGTWVHDQSSRDGTLVGSWGPDQAHQPFVRLPWADELPVLLAEKERLRRSFFLDPRVMLGLAWHLAFHMDARQWLRGFRAFRGWLHARARVAPAPPRPVS